MLRNVIFWVHLIAGVLVGTVILVMSATGVLLTYERQMIAWSDASFHSVPPPDGTHRLRPESLLAALRREHPEVDIAALTVASDPEAPVAIASGRRTLYADAYSGQLLGESAQGVRGFMGRVRAWHRWLAVEGEGRSVARAITGWSNAVFLFIVISGIYLWLPRRWRWTHLRPVMLFSGKLQGKARDFNWHNVIGFWSAVPLFIVVLTALPMSFPWANTLVYRAVGEAPPRPFAGRAGGAGRGDGPASEGAGRAEPSLAGLDALWVTAERQVSGWNTISLRLPVVDAGPVAFAIDAGDGGQPQRRSTLRLDRVSGAVVSYETFGDQSPGSRLRSLARFAHTGEVLGLPGQTVAGLVTAGAVVLVWTGIALALRRFRGWLRRASPSGEAISRQADAA